MMIESGSLTPGVDPAAFGLPPQTALRVEMPDPMLEPFVSRYFVLDSDAIEGGMDSWILPSWARMWFVLAQAPIAVAIGNRAYPELPPAALYGVTSKAMPVHSNGGVSVTVSITALGWARLFRRPADALRDRVTPLSEMMSPELVSEITVRLRAASCASEVKAILDDVLARCLAVPNPAEPIIAKVLTLIESNDVIDVAAAAARLDIDDVTLRRIAKRYFGFPPKLLMMRTRFLHHFVGMMMRPDRAHYDTITPAYHDASHFLRDSQRFLGMTPRRFLALETPYLDALLRASGIVTAAAAKAAAKPAAEARLEVAA